MFGKGIVGVDYTPESCWILTDNFSLPMQWNLKRDCPQFTSNPKMIYIDQSAMVKLNLH